MMTGDSERTAAAIAHKVGVDEYYSEVLPEDKANFVEQEKALGHKVIMIGDGINDSPALSAADAGVAISDGAAIAREIADITIAADNLHEIVTLKKISNRLMQRIHRNYRFIVGFNAGLIALGVGGIIQPTTSSLLHNTSTLYIGLKSMENLLDEQEKINMLVSHWKTIYFCKHNSHFSGKLSGSESLRKLFIFREVIVFFVKIRYTITGN